MILHFVTAFLLQEINASQEKSQRKSNSPSQTGKVPKGRIGLITDGRSPVIRFLMIHFRRAALGFTVFILSPVAWFFQFPLSLSPSKSKKTSTLSLSLFF